ncbi:MAG: AAA family ATPase [Pseudomonadota bacterium]|nr:AAA family ATPase [Pseudomonadota bacterium]
MDSVDTINEHLVRGDIDHPSLFPHLSRLMEKPFIFNIDFGLKDLPTEPGILTIRGARQYGKSTWLEQQLKQSIHSFGPGSAFYLNGENILVADALEQKLESLIPAFSKDAKVRRIFIDEITAIDNWAIVLKRMVDNGKLRNILIVTTGSSATDLHRGTERLPGRKGKLDRTNYLFTPISYREFKRVCGKQLGAKTVISYLLSGGSPVACSELAEFGSIPEYVIELVRDWVDGEIARSGRSRSSLWNVMLVLHRLGTTPIGQAKLARESGLANNTIAHGYTEILHDLGCVIPAYPWDQHREILIKRKECKYHFTNLLVALVYYSGTIRSVDDFLTLPAEKQGIWYEWLIAQEILRRNSIEGTHILAPLAFWQNKNHEIDFVIPRKITEYIEIKRGGTSLLEFSWFPKQFPHSHLTVISKDQYNTDQMTGCLLEDFLLAED